MGWLSWLLGPPRMPDGINEQWKKSSNGNETTVSEGWRITIFPQRNGWTYCVAKVSSRKKSAPIFGGYHPTIVDAKIGAFAEIASIENPPPD